MQTLKKWKIKIKKKDSNDNNKRTSINFFFSCNPQKLFNLVIISLSAHFNVHPVRMYYVLNYRLVSIAIDQANAILIDYNSLK